MPSQTLIAKSLWDIAAYVELTTCDVCQQGPLCPATPLPAKLPPETSSLAVELTCALCGSDQAILFQIECVGKESLTTDRPSVIVDLAGWLTLFQIYHDKSKQEANAAVARNLALDARKSLDEGLLLFYTNDDTPAPEAFFSEESLARFHSQPEHYSRQRLINLRAPLPKPSSL